MAYSDNFRLLLQIKLSTTTDGQEKIMRTDKSFSEVIGLKSVLQNDILNFIFGIILVLLSIYVIIAFISYFSTGQYDQSIILDHSPHEILNKTVSSRTAVARSVLLCLIFYIQVFRPFCVHNSRVYGHGRIAACTGLQDKLVEMVFLPDDSHDLVLGGCGQAPYTDNGQFYFQSGWRSWVVLQSMA